MAGREALEGSGDSEVRYVFVVGVRSASGDDADFETSYKIERELRVGSLVAVRPSGSGAFYRGAPVPELVVLGPSSTRAQLDQCTVLGVTVRPPVAAGANFGLPLAVTSVAVRGSVELHAEHAGILRRLTNEDHPGKGLKGWTRVGERDLLLLSNRSRVVLK